MTLFILQPQTSENDSSLPFNSKPVTIDAAQNNNDNQWVKRIMSQQSFYPSVDKRPYANQSLQNASETSTKPALRREFIEPIKPPVNNVINDLNKQLQQTFEERNWPSVPAVALNDTNETLGSADTIQANEMALAELAYQLPPNVETSSDTSTATEAPTQSLSSFDSNNPIMPVLRKYLAPNYPQSFWYNQIEQDVIATFRLKPNGKAYDIKVTSQRNKYVAFEQEVVKAIKKWKFEPNSLNHSSLQRTYQQMFSFNISDAVEKNCELTHTGTRVRKPTPCNK